MINTLQDLFIYKLLVLNREVSAKEMQDLLGKNQGSVHSAAQNLLRRDLILKRTIKTGVSPTNGGSHKTFYKLNPKKLYRVNEILKEEIEGGS